MSKILTYIDQRFHDGKHTNDPFEQAAEKAAADVLKYWIIFGVLNLLLIYAGGMAGFGIAVLLSPFELYFLVKALMKNIDELIETRIENAAVPNSA